MFRLATTLLFCSLLQLSGLSFSQSIAPAGSPVAPDSIRIKQTDGSMLVLHPKGDSRIHWLETKEGDLVKTEQGNSYYAQIKAGKLISTGIPVSTSSLKSHEFALSTLKQSNTHAIRSILSKTKSVKTIGGVPSTGKILIPVLLVEFSDQEHSRTREEVESMFNQENHNGFGSMRDYFLRASHNQLDIKFDVFGWYNCQITMAEVSESAGSDKAGRLVKKAIQMALGEGVDFSPYDNDGDGDADVVIVMHAGLGADHYGQEEYVWPRSWSLSNTVGLPITRNQIKLDDYVIACEMREYNNQWQNAGIGTFAHEFGHALGLPDLYDGTGKSNGLGYWALMSAGSWLNKGIKPSNVCAWARIQLGWDSPKIVNYDDFNTYRLEPSNSKQDEIYQINTISNKEYFLLANRRKEGNDVAQPASGLAIYHINKEKANQNYEVNDDRDNPGVQLVEADFNSYQGLYAGKDRGTSGDLFPGPLKKTELSKNSQPSSQLFFGEDSKVLITDIQQQEEIITFSLSQFMGLPLEQEVSAYSIFPNPVEDELHIKWNDQEHSPLAIEIFNIIGNKVYESGNSKANWNSMVKLNLHNLPKGLYVLKITEQQKVHIQRVLIK